jgi:hypothetical protein
MAVVRFEGEDGSFMLVETTETGEGSRLDLVSREDGVGATAVTRLEDSLASVRGAAVALMGSVGELEKHDSRLALDEVTLDLALSLGVEGGVVVAKGSARAEASVKLTWRAAPPVKA